MQGPPRPPARKRTTGIAVKFYPAQDTGGAVTFQSHYRDATRPTYTGPQEHNTPEPVPTREWTVADYVPIYGHVTNVDEYGTTFASGHYLPHSNTPQPGDTVETALDLRQSNEALAARLGVTLT